MNGLYATEPERPFEDALAAATTPVCARCNDTHRMPAPEGESGPFGDGTWMCTSCPVPCRSCAVNSGRGAFCAVTPCACKCHGAALGVALAEDREKAGRIIAEARLESLVDGAELLIEGLEARAERLEADGSLASLASRGFLRGFVADLRVLFSGTSAGDDE